MKVEAKWGWQSRLNRIGIVGASSLAGKELSDELTESLLGASDFVLLDDEESAGLITAAGDEVGLIQRLDATSFDRMDFVFFAGDAEVTKKHWLEARRAGASVVDLRMRWKGRWMYWFELRGWRRCWAGAKVWGGSNWI